MNAAKRTSMGQMPELPQPMSIKALALNRLLDGQTLEPLSFAAETGNWRLKALIGELRRMGWPVRTSMRALPTAACPSRQGAAYDLPAREVLLVVLERLDPEAP